jgi:hypothetical protein
MSDEGDGPEESRTHPAQVARRIAADHTGTWRRLITDEHGRLPDYGHST